MALYLSPLTDSSLSHYMDCLSVRPQHSRQHNTKNKISLHSSSPHRLHLETVTHRSVRSGQRESVLIAALSAFAQPCNSVSCTGVLRVRATAPTYSRNAFDDSDLLAKRGGEREDFCCSGFKQFDLRTGCVHLQILHKELERVKRR